MNTISQLVSSSEQPAELRKLLLIDDMPDSSSASLIDKLQALESAVLEISRGVDDLITKVTHLQPTVLILSVDSLQQATLNQLAVVHKDCPLPVVVVAKHYSDKVVKTIVSSGVNAYLVDEVSQARLAVIIDFSIARFEQEQALIKELQATKDKLAERKLIERAKGIIMKQKNVSEDEAYCQMRKSAMNQGQSIAGVAARIISVFDMLE